MMEMEKMHLNILWSFTKHLTILILIRLLCGTGGDRTRVRVGPYPSREAAEKARDRLKSLKLIIGEAAVVRSD